MSDLLARQNWRVKPIVGDRNSFFRAIAEIVYSSQEHHHKVRKNIVGYIPRNATWFNQLLISDNTIEQHVAKMQVSGEWATQVELQAATAHQFTCSL